MKKGIILGISERSCFFAAFFLSLFYFSDAMGQSCPITGGFNYIANGGSSANPANWTDPSIWTTISWVTPKVPPSSGNVAQSIAINDAVVLKNAGSTIEFSQPSTICGELTIEGNFSTSGGCALEVIGKLIVKGDLESGQSIRVWPGAELIVYGNWKITGGQNARIEGTMAVKGNVDNSQGLDLNTSGNLFVYGDYKQGPSSNAINGNVVVVGSLDVPQWSSTGGNGNIYAISGGSFGQTPTKGQSELNANGALKSEYDRFENVFGLSSLTVTLSASPTGPVCAGSQVTFTASSTGATSFKFFINSSTTAVYDGPNSTYTYIPANGDVVTVEASMGSSIATASASALSVVSPPSKPEFTLLNLCPGRTATLSITNGNGSYSYTWTVASPYSLANASTSAPTLTIPSNDALFPVSSSGIKKYPDVEVVVTNSSSCSNTSSNSADKRITVYRMPRTGAAFHLSNNAAR